MNIAPLYNKFILEKPKFALFIILIITLFFASQAPKFELSANADNLLVDTDPDLKFYRQIKARYGSDDFLIITYTPNQGDVFATRNIQDLKKLQHTLEQIPDVNSVITILNIPLINSPHLSLAEIANNKINKYLDPTTDQDLARIEITSSPLYKNLLISKDRKNTALLVNFNHDEKYHQLLNERNSLREIEFERELSKEEIVELNIVSQKFKSHSNSLLKKQQDNIRKIREITAQHKSGAELFIGGVPMIVTDSIEFIHNDIIVFGSAVIGLIIILLLGFTRSIYCTFISIIICVVTTITMVGLLGLVGWPVTIVSSNFISLLLIITLSMAIHIIVCYRHDARLSPKAKTTTILSQTLQKITLPCFYTALTTIIAFISLMISEIIPVIDFGMMMAIGIAISFCIVFTLLPIALSFYKPTFHYNDRDITKIVTSYFANIVIKYRLAVTITAIIIAILGILGIKHLTVENRFIDYYKESTEIYQGMELIDQKFGGTTPLDIVLDAPADFLENKAEPQFANIFAMEEESEDEDNLSNSYWFNSFVIEDIQKIHKFLDDLPETGKIISLDTTMNYLRMITGQNVIDSLTINVARKKMPKQVKNILFNPYLSEDGNQIRFSVRIRESSYGLKRDHLLEKINDYLTQDLGYKNEQIHLNGMLVLYNNILNSLFKSQIMTLAFVFVAIWIMFSILFRSVKLATIAIIPNIIVATIILGIMGWLQIPLDIMTITIAAICIGIAVDDTIHYVHRYTHEFRQDKNYLKTVTRSHNTIGRAMYYTTVTITLGFAILVFSNFVPTIYFGILTGFSMVVALIANITLLPALITYFKPLGK